MHDCEKSCTLLITVINFKLNVIFSLFIGNAKLLNVNQSDLYTSFISKFVYEKIFESRLNERIYVITIIGL